MRFLHELWEALKTRGEGASAPAVVHRDLSVLLRLLRDLFTKDFDRVVIDDAEEFERARRFLEQVNPDVADRLVLHQSDRPIFDHFKVEQQISKALDSEVWLKSGAYLVINQTEALVAIDINTGKYVGKKRLEDTVLQTNLEAVKEIVRQIRLRDLGGIIVIDFIDMDKSKNRAQVVEVLQAELEKDRAKTQLLQISEFGLVELTRQRVKQSLERQLTEDCPYCHSSGRVKSVDTICLEILREVNRLKRDLRGRGVVIRTNPDISKALSGDHRSVMQGVRDTVQGHVNVVADQTFHQERFEVSNL